MNKITYFIIALFFTNLSLYAQDDMLDLLGDDEEEIVVTTASFKATRIINGHSIETRRKGTLDFLISHRFGEIYGDKGGASELFGIDNSNIRFALEYAVSDNLMFGVGRSSFQKTLDGFLKYKLLKQTSGAKNFPFTITYLGSATINTLPFIDTTRNNHFSARLAFTNQLLVARKFNDNLSIQIAPTLVHHNLVLTEDDPNDIFAVGVSLRYKLTPSFSINGEYFYQANPLKSIETDNSFAIAAELETGGHVFQVSVTNSRAMIEKGFITETGAFTDTDFPLHLGFNIFRTF